MTKSEFIATRDGYRRSFKRQALIFLAFLFAFWVSSSLIKNLFSEEIRPIFSVCVILALGGMLIAGLIWLNILPFTLARKMNLVCPHCDANFAQRKSNAPMQVVIATGNCSECGEPVFNQDDRA